MKRFSETTRFDDPSYSALPVEMKVAREYIAAKCDNAGVWLPNFKLADFQIGAVVDWKTFREKLESEKQLTVLPNGSWLMVGFIQEQYGELNTDPAKQSNVHKSVIAALRKNGVSYPFNSENPTLREGFKEASRSLQGQDKDKDKDQDQDRREVQEGTKTPTLAEVLAYSSSPTGNVPPDVAEIWWNEHEARPRHAKGGYTDKSGCLVFDWKAALRGFSQRWRNIDAQRNQPRPARSAPAQTPMKFEDEPPR